jgi:hypothetical protein
MADSAATDEDVPVPIDVLANDSDRDGDLDPSTLRVTVPPAAGLAAVTGSQVVYTPAPDDNGTEEFDYEICDAGSRCSSASVTITVRAVNDAPIAVDDVADGLPWTDVTIDVLANDSDIDGGTLTIVSYDATSTLGATVVCTTTCVYTPTDLTTQPDSFAYVVSDGRGGTGSATVVITAPVLDGTFYLRAAGSGDQVSTPVLPLSTETAVTNDVLPNYDADRDSSPGLFLLRGAGGPPALLALTDPTRYQLWSIATGEDLVIDGTMSLDIWAGMSMLQTGARGRLQAFVLDCPATTVDGTDCIEISRANVNRNPWTAIDGAWERAVFDLGTVSHTVPTDRALAIKLTVAGINSDDDMRIAFDAVDFESRLVIWSG